MGFGQAERGVDGGGAIAALAEEVDELVEGRAVAFEFLNRAEIGEAGAFEGGDPDGGLRADGPPGACAPGEVDAEESRFAHGGKVNGINRQANVRDTPEA